MEIPSSGRRNSPPVSTPSFSASIHRLNSE
jgi:hypothetical protein